MNLDELFHLFRLVYQVNLGLFSVRCKLPAVRPSAAAASFLSLTAGINDLLYLEHSILVRYRIFIVGSADWESCSIFLSTSYYIFRFSHNNVKSIDVYYHLQGSQGQEWYCPAMFTDMDYELEEDKLWVTIVFSPFLICVMQVCVTVCGSSVHTCDHIYW